MKNKPEPFSSPKRRMRPVAFLWCILIISLICALPSLPTGAAEDTTPPIVIGPTVALQSVNIASLPNKTEYFVGDDFDASGAKLLLIYNNGTMDVIDVEPSWVECDISTAGEKTATVSYQNMSCTFSVTVKPVEISTMSIATPPTKTEYFLGESFSPDGCTITVKYTNGDTETVKVTKDMCSYDSSKTGEVTVTLSYKDKSCTLNITVKPVEIATMSIATLPTKTEYFLGESFSPDGCTLTVKYTNGDTETVKVTKDMCSYDSSQAGKVMVTVSYKEASCRFGITLKAVELTSITIDKKPSKTSYFTGDELDTSGISVKAHYNNGEVINVSDSVAFSGFDSISAGEKTVTVSYGECLATFKVTVVEPSVTKIKISKLPKTNYYDGEAFSSEGCTLTVTFNSGKTAEISDGLAFEGFDSSKLGEQKITVKYSGKTATFTVTVSLSPSHIHTSLPAQRPAEPTCTENGLEIVVCAVCGQNVSEKILPAQGHAFGEFTVSVLPTGSTEGEKVRVCSTCSAEEKVSIKKLVNTMSAGSITLTLTGENAFFPYLSTLAASDLFPTMTPENVKALEAQLAAIAENVKLLYVIDAKVFLEDGTQFVASDGARITLSGISETENLYTLIGGVKTELAVENGCISIDTNGAEQFLIFSSVPTPTTPETTLPTAPDTTPAPDTQAPSTTSPDTQDLGTTAGGTDNGSANIPAVLIIVAAIIAVIVLVVIIYLYIIKKFYY